VKAVYVILIIDFNNFNIALDLTKLNTSKQHLIRFIFIERFARIYY
jgi:hypothetical protein